MSNPKSNQSKSGTDAPASKPLSRDQKKIGRFYKFEVTEQRFDTVKKMSSRMMWKYLSRGLIFGFLLEALMTQTRIYENIIRSTTMKRLSTLTCNRRRQAVGEPSLAG